MEYYTNKNKAQHQRHGLHQHGAVAVLIAGGAEDQEDAEERGGAAKPQQHQIGLLEEFRQRSPESQHPNSPLCK